MGCAMFFGQGAFGRAACRADELQAQGLGPLAGDQADTPRRSVKENKVAGLQAFNRQGLLQQVLRREAFQHHGRAGVKGDVVRQLAHRFGRHHTALAVAARRVAGIGRAVAHLEVRDPCAHGFNNACTLHAQRQGQGIGIKARALVDINEVQAASLVRNADFARPRLAHGQVHPVHLLGATVGGDLNGFAALCHVQRPV